MPFFYPCPYDFQPMDNEMYRNDMIRQADPFTYPENVPVALQLISEAVSGEREDELFYDYLISVAPTMEAKNIITGIRDDERKHNRMFRKIYPELTGKMLPPGQDVEFERPRTYCDGVKKALLGELGAVQRYRRILFALQNRVHINMLTEIITDELRHANLYNLLFHLGQCS
jgi:rubrerythrin